MFTLQIGETEDKSGVTALRVLLGNDLELLDQSTGGKTPGEVQKNRNKWTIFVRGVDFDLSKYDNCSCALHVLLTAEGVIIYNNRGSFLCLFRNGDLCGHLL